MCYETQVQSAGNVDRGRRTARTAGCILAWLAACALLATERLGALDSATAVPLDANLYWRCTDILRQGLSAKEFWPSMHAAEALTETNLGDVVRFRLRPRLPAEIDGNRRCGLARELVRASDTVRSAVLVDVLTNPKSTADERIHAAESLYKVNAGGRAEAPLRASLDTGKPVLELMAAAALVRAGHNDLLPRIRRRLSDADPRTFRIAAWLCGRLGDDAAVPALKRLLKVKCDPLSHSFVVNALARLGDPDSRRQVHEELKSSDPGVRTYAAAALGAYGTPTAIRLLRPLLNDANLDTRIRAAQAILRLTRRRLAADRDRDGVPDAVELELGTPQNSPEPFAVLWRGQSRKLPPDVNPERVAPYPVEVRFCHTGGDRYLWEVRFDRHYSDVRTVFHMYMDLDNDRSNGRQDKDWVRGVDVMYTFSNARLDPRFFTPSLRTRPDWPVRGMILGDTLWLCDDVRVRREAGRTGFRMWTLSEYRNPAGKVARRFSTPDQIVRALLHMGRTVPELPFPKLQGFRSFPPSWELRHRLQSAPDTVELTPNPAACSDAEMQGNGAVDLAGYGAGTAGFTVPGAIGPRFVAVYAQALSGGLGAVELRVNNARAGTLVAGAAESPGVLLSAIEPITFHKGDRLEFRTLPRSGRLRLRQVLLPTAPPTWPPLRIDHLTTAVLPPRAGETRDRVTISWTTNRPATCELRTTQTRGGRSRRVVVDPEPVEVHRFTIPAAWQSGAGNEVQVWLSARDSLGVTAEAGPATVPFRRPRPEKTAAWSSRRIPLTVAEPTRTPRRAWPLRSGVPLPPKTLADPARCRVLDPTGKPVPGQFRALAYWPDGSVKWLLTEFEADTVAGPRSVAPAGYTLVTNVSPYETQDTPRVAVRQTPEAVIVDTGTLRIILRRDQFDPFAAVEVNGRRLAKAPGRGLVVVDGDGAVYTSCSTKPDEMLVEADGPVRATVRVRGHVAGAVARKGMAYLCRMDFFAGRRMVRCTLSLDNSLVGRKMSLFREATLHIPVSAVRTAQFGGDGSSVVRTPQLPARLLQDYDNRWRLSSGANGNEIASGKRAAGFAAVPDARVAVRDFWQLYPKALAVDRTGLTVEFLPKIPEDQYTSDEDRKLLSKLYFWSDKGRYKLRAGARITTVFTVDFGKPPSTTTFAAHVRQPLFAACTPDWYCASRAVGRIAPRRPGAFPKYAENLDNAFAGFLSRREQVREYGFMNYGDWYGERRWNWGNQEYDTQGALALNYLRTGNLAMLRRALEAESHNADIDTIHHSVNPNDVGRVHIHCLGHTGGYFPAGFKGMSRSFTGGAMTPSHTWDRGHFLLWALTGEPRYRETGDLVAEHLASVDANKAAIGRSRSGGWALIALTGAYQATGDPYYLNAARLLTRKILEKQRPNGQWRHPIWEARDRTPQPWGCKPFMTGIILHGLCMMDRIDPSDAVKAAILRGARYLWDKTYVRKDHGFVYAEAPRFMGRGGIWTLPLVGDGLAYACRLDPRHRDKDLLIEACSWNFHKAGISSFGKSFTQGACFMPYMLTELPRLGITRIQPPIEQDVLHLREAVVLPVGGSTELRIWIERKQSESADWTAVFAQGAERWLRLPADRTLRWRATPGLSGSPIVPVQAPTKPAREKLRVTLRSGKRTEHTIMLFGAVAARKPGRRIGWVTGKDDWLRRAAEACGEKIARIPDLRTADLAGYGAIIIGAEGFEKRFAHCREASVKLLEFVAAGGRLVCGQLNDGNWRLGFLPFDLILSDAGSESGRIIDSRHPLFNRPVRFSRLPTVACYDSIVRAAPEWRTLMQDTAGRPAIVEATVGTGRVLVVMPSFDRPVLNAEADAETRKACRGFIRNLIACARRLTPPFEERPD
ncbi:MAG: hypothetical protein GXP31_06855 [Kiritimatiellaeota bacterium]|nr:hypothetical protein [Kiritimatiellota bacterium]